MSNQKDHYLFISQNDWKKYIDVFMTAFDRIAKKPKITSVFPLNLITSVEAQIECLLL